MSDDFMRRDLVRSGLRPEDFPKPPHALQARGGVRVYRIPYPGGSAYWKDRYDRKDDKYLGPKGTPTELYWAQEIGSFANAAATASVEGEKKAVLFHMTTGIPTVGLPGCHGWAEHTPESEEGLLDSDKAPTQLRDQLKAALTSTKVHYVLIDGDWQSNSNVGKALAGYAMELEWLGVATVWAIDLRDYGGYDDWFIKEFGAHRGQWPDKASVLKKLLSLPRINTNELAASHNYMLGSIDRFNRGHTDFTDRGHATQWLRLVGPTNVLHLTDCREWVIWRDGQWKKVGKQPLEEVNLLGYHYLRKPMELEGVIRSLKDKEDKKDKMNVLIAQAESLAAAGRKVSSVPAREKVLKDVASRQLQQATLASFDNDPDLLAVADGRVVDLRTGSVRAEQQADRLLQRCAAAYDGTEPTGPGAERMQRFINEITAVEHGRPDPEMARWLQRRVGAALRGRCQLGALELWVGGGANGKSLLADVLGAALGTYAVTLPSGVVLSSFDHRSAEAASPFLSKAVGKRLVFAAETKDTDHLDLPKVKTMTGVSDKMAIRANYQDGAEYPITWTIIVLTNSLPNISQSDDAIWDRLAPLPFRCRWRREEGDDTQLPQADIALRDKWVKDKDAQRWILWWAIQGSALYEREGLPNKPTVIHQLKSEYKGEQDYIGRWLEGNYLLAAAERCLSWEVYESYLVFCRKEGIKGEVKKSTFTRRLKERFKTITTQESNGKSYYVGLAKCGK